MIAPEAIRALEIRQSLSKSSVKKLDALALRAVDGRIRGAYWYYGAHTGRWAGKGVQPQNLPRGTVKPEQYQDIVDAIVNRKDLTPYGLPLEIVSSCLRGAFQAPPGKVLVVCDFAQVELRVLAWLSNCFEMQSVFASNGDLYLSFASSHLYRKPLEDVTKRERQVSKSAVLGCGYGQGAGYMKFDVAGDPDKSGLWGYAAKMGVELTQEESFTAVQAFRNAYRRVVNYWYECERAAVNAVENPGEHYYAGPVSFIATAPDAKILFAVLPSGRKLFYLRPQLEEGVYRPQLSYEGLKLNKWRRIRTYGGHLVENLCQAVARDLMAEAQLEADRQGFTIVGHSHDEIISLEDEGSNRLPQLEQIMSAVPDWADGLLLGAEGYESRIYRK